jgi:proline dehydrogenase
MASFSDRWALPDWQSTLIWCSERNAHGIRCIVDVLGESARDERQADQAVKAYLCCARSIRENSLDASISVKLTALGAIFDRDVCRENVLRVLRGASSQRVGFEIDMEGRPLVDYTIETAIACAEEVKPITLAMQAYLDRSSKDLERLYGLGVKVRLVKGAYLGDVSDFKEVQRRFICLFKVLLNAGRPFCIGTHDPDILAWIGERAEDDRGLVELGFLKGLADCAKVQLQSQGWRVAEYVPFGHSRVAYESRRMKYLLELEGLNKSPML